MTRKSTTSRRLAATNTPQPTNNDRYKEVWDHVVSQLGLLYKDGITRLTIKEEQLSALIGISRSSLQKARSKYHPGCTESPLPTYCKIPGIGVVYRLNDVIDWYLRLSERHNAGE